MIEADLELTTPSGPVRIETEHDELVVKVPDARTGLDLLGIVNGSMGGRQSVQALDDFLRANGVGLRIRVHGAEVAHLGAGAQAGVVTRLLHSAVLR